MAAGKEYLCIVMDVGPTIRASGGLPHSIEAVRQILLQKMLYAKKDDVAIVQFGREDTDNDLAADSESQYQHIVRIRGFHDEAPMMSTFHELEAWASPEVQAAPTPAGDPFDAVVLGVWMLSQVKVTGRAKAAKRLVVVTDCLSRIAGEGEGEAFAEQVRTMEEQMGGEGIAMDLYTVDFAQHARGGHPQLGHPGHGRKRHHGDDHAVSSSSSSSSLSAALTLTPDQEETRRATGSTLLQLVRASGGHACSVTTVMGMLSRLRARAVGQVTKFRGDLCVGGEGPSALRVPVWSYSLTSEAKPPSLKKAAAAALVGDDGRLKTSAKRPLPAFRFEGEAEEAYPSARAEEEVVEDEGAGAGSSAGAGLTFKREYRIVPQAKPEEAEGLAVPPEGEEAAGAGLGGDDYGAAGYGDAGGDELGGDAGAASSSSSAAAPAQGAIVDRTALAKMYRYGRDALVVGPGDESALKWDHDRELAVHGFTPCGAIPRYLVMGAVDVIVPSQDPKVDGPTVAGALSALARAMAAEGVVGVARHVKRKGSAPLWGVLVPALATGGEEGDGAVPAGGEEGDEEEDPGSIAPTAPSQSGRGSSSSSSAAAPASAAGAFVTTAPAGLPDCLLFCPLPFSDDIRQYAFADFTVDPRAAPPADLLAAVDGLIDGLDLQHVRDPATGHAAPALDPRSTFNPQLARFHAVVAQRARVNEMGAAPLAPLPAAVAAYLFPDAQLSQRAAKQIDAFRHAAGPMLQRAPGGRSDPLLAGRHLFTEMQEEEGGTAAGGKYNDEAAYAKGEPASKRARHEGAGGGRDATGAPASSGTAEPRELQEMAHAKRLLQEGMHGVGGRDSGRGLHGSAPPAHVGSTDPVADFTAMLARRDKDVSETAVNDMARVIKGLARDSLSHDKALDALASMRRGAMSHCHEETFNGVLRDLLGEARGTGPSARSVATLLSRAKKHRPTLGLLTNDDTGNVTTTTADAEQFWHDVTSLGGESRAATHQASIPDEGMAYEE